MPFVGPLSTGLLFLSLLGTAGCGAAENTAENSGGSVAAGKIEKMLMDHPLRDISAKDLEGRPISLAGLKGKVVLLNFWGAWCGPCRVEIPDLVKMHQELNGKGFEIVGVNSGDERQFVPLFVARNKMLYPVVFDEGFTDLYSINAFPTNIVIDRRGRIRYVLEGFSPQSISILRGVIEYLLTATNRTD